MCFYLITFLKKKNSTFYSLQFDFILKSTLQIWFNLVHIKMVNESSNVNAWCENQWLLFSCIKHTQFYFSYDFHQVNVWLQKLPSNVRKRVEVAKLCFPQKKCIHYLFGFDRAISCVIYQLKAQDWVQIRPVMRI